MDKKLLQKRAEKIIFKDSIPEYGGGIAPFDNLDLKGIDQLIEMELIDLEDDYYSTEIIIDFIRDHPEFTAIGYLVGSSREDFRVSITGLRANITEKNYPDIDLMLLKTLFLCEFRRFNQFIFESDHLMADNN